MMPWAIIQAENKLLFFKKNKNQKPFFKDIMCQVLPVLFFPPIPEELN